MAKYRDIAGQKFGMLTPLYALSERKDKCVQWMCRCDCGAMKALPSTDLLRHRVKSCGCLKHRAKEIYGERRGHLMALQATGERDGNGSALYEWRCDCGNVFVRPIRGTMRNTARICPDCLRALKQSQINAARDNRAEEETTGLTPRYLENLMNGVPTTRNNSGVRGVSWHKGHQRWVAAGRKDGRVVRLGEYETLGEARDARMRFVQKEYGPAAARMGIEEDMIGQGVF